MRVFATFNGSHGDVCPVCETAAPRPTVLVPIPGTEDGNNMQAKQYHKACFELAIQMMEAEQEMEARNG